MNDILATVKRLHALKDRIDDAIELLETVACIEAEQPLQSPSTEAGGSQDAPKAPEASASPPKPETKEAEVETRKFLADEKRKHVLRSIKDLTEPFTAADLAAVTNSSPGSAAKFLQAFATQNLVQADGQGGWRRLPPYAKVSL